MDELTIGDKIYISSKRAAEITGYAKDYIGQLCREGRVNARLVGRNWYVLEESLRNHRFGEEAGKGEEKEGGGAQKAAQITPTWEAPRYEAEEPVRISELLDTEPADDKDVSHEEVRSHAEQSVVADMQSAWKDWFLKREHEHEEAVEVPTRETREDQDATRETDEAGSTEEAVPVHIERVITEERQPEQVDLRQEDESQVVFGHGRARNQASKEKKTSLQPRNRLERPATMVSIIIALTSLSLALLGSGMFDPYAASSMLDIEFIQYLSGISVEQAI